MMSLEDIEANVKHENESSNAYESCEEIYGGSMMPIVIQTLQVPSEEQYLEIAIRSLPKGLSIRPTSVSGGQYGVWCDSVIPKGIKFGPYDAAAYQLSLTQQGTDTSIDGIEHSWLQFINCTSNKDQMNLITIENGQKIYYSTSKQISCDEELLAWNDGSFLETGAMKKELEFADIIEMNNEERDISVLSTYDDMMPRRFTTAETSVYHFSDRGTRDTVWSRGAIRLLIKTYKGMDQKMFYRLKDKWKAISNVLQQNGYHLSAEDCDQKWRNLKKTYRLVKYNRENTGRGRLTWEYFDIMREVVQSDAYKNQNNSLMTVCGDSTDTSNKEQLSRKEMSFICNENSSSEKILPDTPVTSMTSTDLSQQSNECNKPITKVLHKETYSVPPPWFKKLEDERREEKKQLLEMLDKMHSETVKVMEKRNNILQKLVNILESRNCDT